MRSDKSQLLLLVGVVLLVGSMGAGYEVWDTEYTHYIEETEDFNASREGNLRYENLSDRGQTVVDRTIAREEYVISSRSRLPADFEYATDHSYLGFGEYTIQRDGQTYRLRTYEAGPSFAAFLITLGLLAPWSLGAGLTVYGLWKQR